MSLVDDGDGAEPDVQTLYAKVKKLLLTYPQKPRWSPSYETINGLELHSETAYGVINQYHTLLNQNIFTKCRSNLDEQSIITDLDYNRSLKSSLNKRQYDESLLFIDSENHSNLTNLNKYVLQNLIHTLQHTDIVPYHQKPRRALLVTKTVGITTSDAHKFNDREYFWGQHNRRIVQVQVCFDKHVHGLQVKWLVSKRDGHPGCTKTDIYSGSQHFSSRFSGKNIDTLVLSHNEYISAITGTCSQWVDSLVIHTNFGRVKSFGSSNEGEPFDLEIPENCQVLGFCGSYSSQLYTLGALYRPIIKKESRIMVQHINKRIIKIRQISMKLQNLFADIDKKCNSDLMLLKYLRSNQQSLTTQHKKRRSYKTSNIQNTWIMEILKVLVKSAAKNDPTVVPQILNILAMILEDNTMNILKRDNKRERDKKNDEVEDDPYNDLMDFMKSIAVDNGQLVLGSQQNDDSNQEVNGLAISMNDQDSPNHHNQCVRVMIAVAIARGSLYDMLSIVKMLLCRKSNGKRIYNVSKILHKLHDHVAHLKLGSSKNVDFRGNDQEFHPSETIAKYAPFLQQSDDFDSDDLSQSDMLSGLELVIILLSELELIALMNESNKTWKLSKEALNAPLHIDCSLKVLKTLNEILGLLINKTHYENASDLVHRGLYHTLKLLTVQVSAVDKLRITLDKFCIPHTRINEIKSTLLDITRSDMNLPAACVEAACKTLVKGQKLFFASINSKLIYLLALLIRQQEIEQNERCIPINDNDEQPTNNLKLRKFLHDFSDKLVDPLSSISPVEIEVTLPVMLNQFGSVGQPSQLIDSLLSVDENDNENEEKKQGNEEKGNEDDILQNGDEIRKLFFGTLKMLVSNCSIDVHNLQNDNERMAQLLLDLQSMLLFRYQSKFEYGDETMHDFSDQIPISLQKMWHKLNTNPFQIESKQQKNIDECIFEYAKHVIAVSTQMLEAIYAQSDEHGLSFFFEHDCQILHTSFFGKITIPLLTNLLGLVETSNKDTQKQKIFKHLMRNKLVNHLLTPHISDLLKLIDQILSKSQQYAQEKLSKEYKTVIEKRESPHPYPLGQTIKKLVTIPGAEQLTVIFDQSVCCTSSDKDFLRIFTKTVNGYVAVTPPISGSSNKWPDAVVVPGDCILLHFTSKNNINSKINEDEEDRMDEMKSDYGFKVTVQGNILQDPMHKLRWLEDLSCLMVKFHTTIASTFIDPGHLGVSFDALIPFPLLLIGGHYPYKVPMEIHNNVKENDDQTHLYLHQIQSWVQLKRNWNHKLLDELSWKIYNFKQALLENDDSDDEHSPTLCSDFDALTLAMNQLMVCTPRSSILLYETETQITKNIVARLHCSMFAVLLRHTGIITKFEAYIRSLQTSPQHLKTPKKKLRSRKKSLGMVPREIQILWDRARVGVNHILSDVQTEKDLEQKSNKLTKRIELLMKISPAFLHIKEITGSFDTTKLVSYPQGYLTPKGKQAPWICNICFHFNEANQVYCTICEADKRMNKTQGINQRFAWDEKNFPSEELYKSFQSVCCVENIIRSQRHTSHNQNHVTVAPIKKLVKQIITFIIENDTEPKVFHDLLLMQSTLGLFRIKGLQIIYENISNLSYAPNIAQFAENFSNLLTLSNVESMSVTQTLNLTESKQIEKSVAVLKLSSLHSGGFSHILANIECCGHAISSEILSFLQNIIRFLFDQSTKCTDHQSGFTTPFLHLMGTLIGTQDLEFISSTKIIPYLSEFFSLKSLNHKNKINVSFQQRFAAWNAFRTLAYSTSFPMFSSLPTITVNNIQHQQTRADNTVSNASPSSKCVALFTEKTKNSRLHVFESIIGVVGNELKTLYKAQQNRVFNDYNEQSLREILLSLQDRPKSQGKNANDLPASKHMLKRSKWSCGVCTYRNGRDDDTCSMCFRGVRPVSGHNDNACDDINISWICLSCGFENSPCLQTLQCVQCKQINLSISPRTSLYTKKLKMLKWVSRLREQSICYADTQYLYLLQKEIGWMLSSTPTSTESTTNTNSAVTTPKKGPKVIESDNESSDTSSVFNSPFLSKNDAGNDQNVHVLATAFGINQLLWLLLRCCPSESFLKLLQQDQQIIILCIDIAMDRSKIANLSPISQILAIKLLTWILPTLSPSILARYYNESSCDAFFESIFNEIGETDYCSYTSLHECPLKKEEDRILSNVRLQLLYLVRILFHHSNWTHVIENICIRILTIPFMKSEDVSMDSPVRSRQHSSHSVEIYANNSKDFKHSHSRSASHSSKSTPNHSTEKSSATSDNDDDEKEELHLIELTDIHELVQTPLSKTYESAPSAVKRQLLFDDHSRDGTDEKSNANINIIFDERSKKSFTSSCTRNGENISLQTIASKRNVHILHKVIGTLCVMGEYMCSLHEGVRVKVKHQDKEFRGTIIKMKYLNTSDPTGEFTETTILCDNGLNLSINITNKKEFEISMLDQTSFNPLKLCRPKYLLLLLRSYLHETFISPQSTEFVYYKAICRRVVSVIRQFSRYNEFAPMIHKFGIANDLIAISLKPLQKFEDYFDSTIKEENIWKMDSKLKNLETWRKNLKIGSIIDCQDRLSKWFESEIVQFDQTSNKLLIHYCEWSSKWDEWLPLESERLKPWRTHTDGSFKNRGYNPFNPREQDLLDLKLRNPSNNIDILQKCLLGLRKFKKVGSEWSNGTRTPIFADESGVESENESFGGHPMVAISDRSSRTNHVRKTYEDDEVSSNDSSYEDAPSPLSPVASVKSVEKSTSSKTGIPCPNHAYLATNNHQSNVWTDIISNESLKITMSDKRNKISNGSSSKQPKFVLNGNCNICHEFKPNQPPTNHVSDDYAYAGSTLFLSLNLPRKVTSNQNEHFASLFEWSFVNESAKSEQICKFNIGFSANHLVIKDSFDAMQHTPISLETESDQKQQCLMIMISITKDRYRLFTNCEHARFTKDLSNIPLPKDSKMTFSLTKDKSDGLDGIGVQRIAIWRWVSLDYMAFNYLCKWKDIFIESLQHMNPAKQTTIFEKNYRKNMNDSSEEDVSFTVVDLVSEDYKVETPTTYNEYSIILSFKLTEEKLKTPICLIQIPDDLMLSIIDHDQTQLVKTEELSTPRRGTKSGTNSPKTQEQQLRSIASNFFDEAIYTPKSENPRKMAKKHKLGKLLKANKPSTDIPMIWIDKRGIIWICDEKTNKKVNVNEEHVISVCVNLKNRQLSLIFHTDEIIKINLNKLHAKNQNKYKWQQHFKQNGCWTLKSKLIFGGSIHPMITDKCQKQNNFIIQRISIKPKCCSLHEAISLALTSYFDSDPLSDLMGNLGFNLEQIKYSKKWRRTHDSAQWMDVLKKIVKNRKKLTPKKALPKGNVKIQFKKKTKKSKQSKIDSAAMPPPVSSMRSKNHIFKHRKATKTTQYAHICAATQLDSVSPEEIRWKIYQKSMMFHTAHYSKELSEIKEDSNSSDNGDKLYDFDKMKNDLLLCSHWLYCHLPSASHKKEILAKRLCNFTAWNQQKTWDVLSKIKLDSDGKMEQQTWYHLVEIMYEYQSRQIAMKFNQNSNISMGRKRHYLYGDKTFDELYVHMHSHWIELEKTCKKTRDEASGTQISDYQLSGSNTVYDTSNRIYQDFINNRCKFHSHKLLYKYKEIGNYDEISKKNFGKLSDIIETNLCSLYARDSVLSFLDEHCCYDDNLKGLLPSINFHHAFDNISDNENLLKFIELVFEEDKSARIHALEKALGYGIEEEVALFDVGIFLNEQTGSMSPRNSNLEQQSDASFMSANQRHGYPVIAALINTICSQLLRYFDAIHRDVNSEEEDEEKVNDNKKSCKIYDIRKGQDINIEFALWLVSIFVNILIKCTKYKKLQKMLVLVFNDTLMSLLFDCIVIGPPSVGMKVALMVSQIIEMYPKKNPFETLKNKLFETSKICDNIATDKSTKSKSSSAEKPELCVFVKHVAVIGNVLQDLHQASAQTTDVIHALLQLMLSLVSCNYHHSYTLDLTTITWFQSVYSTYTTLKWFAIKDKEKRTASALQFLSPTFYSNLYETLSGWHELSDDETKRICVNALQNQHIDRCINLLDAFQSLLKLPRSQLCTQQILTEFKANLNVFCEISIALKVDKLDSIQEIITTTQKLKENEDSNKEMKRDWLILQQFKQLCTKLCAAFNLLYYTIFADDECNVIDRGITRLSPEYDATITELIQKSRAEFEATDISDKFSFEACCLTKEHFIWCPDLENIDNLSVNVRQQSIYALNQLITRNFHYIDVSNKSNVGMFGHLLCSLSRHLLLSDVTLDILSHSLEQSQDGQANEPSFQVDRFRCKTVAEPDYLMFTECMKQLHSFKPDTFRLEPYAKAWKCQFANEHATDAGGPYRESIEWMMHEVERNQHLKLFMLCPNGQNGHGLNRDKYLPSPNKCSYQDEKMYIFLGKLMGLAMRTKELLPLNIAPLIWKRICNDPITTKDIEAVDKSAFSIFQHLDAFIKILDEYSDEIEDEREENIFQRMNESKKQHSQKEVEEMTAQIEIFNSLMVRTRSKFQGKSSDGNTYPLIPNGELIPITHKNVKHYKTAYINFRINEYDFACNAIRRGLATVIPINILNIFCWQKVEELICGKAAIDIKLFKQMTSYSNCGLNDRTIQLFWDVVKHKMDNSERSKLLQFVWGRSRLPSNKKDFDKKMSILLLDHGTNNPNDYLPISHTCFFQLDLPKYTSLDVMHQKLIYAITHCGSIDTDE